MLLICNTSKVTYYGWHGGW